MKINSIKFSSGKATVEYGLHDNYDPQLFESAVCKNLEDLEDTYNDLQIQAMTGESLEDAYESGKKWTWLTIATIGLVIIAITVILGLCSSQQL